MKKLNLISPQILKLNLLEEIKSLLMEREAEGLERFSAQLQKESLDKIKKEMEQNFKWFIGIGFDAKFQIFSSLLTRLEILEEFDTFKLSCVFGPYDSEAEALSETSPKNW